MKKTFTLILSLFLGWSALAQAPGVVKDIYPGNPSSLPFYDNGIVEFNGKIYFSADDSIHGVELWVTDGTENGTVLVKDIYPGATGSEAQNYYVVNGSLLFTARDDAHGLELWRTDGTEAGTSIVKDIRVGNTDAIPFLSSQQNDYYVWNDVLYFPANEGTNGWELWRSDGTEAGTFLVKNIYTSSGSSGHSFPMHYAEHNGKLYFQARSSANGEELWVTDGTQAGTTMVKDIEAGAFGSTPSDLVSCNGYLLFIADDGVVQQELWRSDGTEAGTVLVKDIKPMIAFTGGLQTQPNTVEKRLVKIGDMVYFSADDGTNGIELWRSDGTEVGTHMVKDASTDDEPGYAPQNFAVLDDVLYYKYDDNQSGQELWRSDGTESGTYMVKNINPGSSGAFSLPTNVYVYKDHIYFGAAKDGSTFNTELWKSDGTEAGTVLVADVNPGFDGSFPFQFIGMQDYLFFGGYSEPTGNELWRYSLIQVEPLSISIQETNAIDCFGDSDGAISVTVNGGQMPYNFAWNPAGVSGQNPGNLTAGTYSVTVTDAFGSTISASIEISEPAELTATVQSTAATGSLSNGSAQATATGGTPPYHFTWNTVPPTSGEVINNVIAGEYSVTITDNKGCTVVETVIVEMESGVDEAFAQNISIVPTLCNGSFTIRTQNNPLTGMEVCLLESNGKEVQRWLNVSSNEWLEMTMQCAGLYFVKIKSGDHVVLKRMMFKP